MTQPDQTTGGPVVSSAVFGRVEGTKSGKVHRLVEGVGMWRVDHSPGDSLTLYRALPDSSLTAKDLGCKVCLKRDEISPYKSKPWPENPNDLAGKLLASLKRGGEEEPDHFTRCGGEPGEPTFYGRDSEADLAGEDGYCRGCPDCRPQADDARLQRVAEAIAAHLTTDDDLQEDFCLGVARDVLRAIDMPAFFSPSHFAHRFKEPETNALISRPQALGGEEQSDQVVAFMDAAVAALESDAHLELVGAEAEEAARIVERVFRRSLLGDEAIQAGAYAEYHWLNPNGPNTQEAAEERESYIEPFKAGLETALNSTTKNPEEGR